jgi:hypothetical protein
MVAARHEETAARATVRSEDAGYIVGEDANGVVVEVEVERSGAPDVAPLGGDHLRVGDVFGGEKAMANLGF